MCTPNLAKLLDRLCAAMPDQIYSEKYGVKPGLISELQRVRREINTNELDMPAREVVALLERGAHEIGKAWPITDKASIISSPWNNLKVGHYLYRIPGRETPEQVTIEYGRGDFAGELFVRNSPNFIPDRLKNIPVTATFELFDSIAESILAEIKKEILIYRKGVVSSYQDCCKLQEIYDNDEEFASAILCLIPEFEYPDYAYKTIKEIVREIDQLHPDLPAVEIPAEESSYSPSP